MYKQNYLCQCYQSKYKRGIELWLSCMFYIPSFFIDVKWWGLNAIYQQIIWLSFCSHLNGVHIFMLRWLIDQKFANILMSIMRSRGDYYAWIKRFIKETINVLFLQKFFWCYRKSKCIKTTRKTGKLLKYFINISWN